MSTPVTLFANNPSTTATSTSGTTSPAALTTETWTVSSSAAYPAAATGVSQFHIADPAQPTEIIAVTNVSGTTWSVTRGVENTTPVAHATGATYYQIVSAADLTSMGPKPPVTLTDASTIAVNAALANVFRVTLGGNRTLGTPSNPRDGQSITVEVIQPASSGPYTLSYSVAYSFTATAPQPSLSTNASSHDFISFIYDTGQSLWVCTGYVLAQYAALVTIAQGGTGQTTQAAALTALTGVQTSGQYLRSNGTSAALAPITAADLPYDSTAAHILGEGTQTAGSNAKPADSGHIHPASSIIPADHGLLAWSYDLDAAGQSVTLIAGTVYLVKIPIRAAITATNLWFAVGVAGSGVSSGSFVGLYSSAGSLLSGSSDLGTSIAAGNHEMPLTTPQALSGGTFVWAAIVVNQASTQPSFACPYNFTGSARQNINLTAANYRAAVPAGGTGQTTLPGSFTPSSNSGAGIAAVWFGIS